MKKKVGLENIYYQDESGFDDYYTRTHGYSIKGNNHRIETKISGKRYERQSVMSLRNNKKLTTSSVIIMDNASYHKSQTLKDLFKQHNHTLVFLPAYSPDLNPIEKLWGTIKQQLRNYYDYTLSLYENLSLAICKYCQ